jgi:hypothetical protein
MRNSWPGSWIHSFRRSGASTVSTFVLLSRDEGAGWGNGRFLLLQINATNPIREAGIIVSISKDERFELPYNAGIYNRRALR